jgi:hypothetical protein
LDDAKAKVWSTMSTLKDDRLPSVTAIAEYIGTNERRVRHLIAVHGFPHKKVGGKIESRRSWIDHYYAEPDRPAASNGGER